MGLQVGILGPLRVEGKVGEIPLERTSHRRLLSILALDANRRLSTDVLIDRFWGEDTPPTAKAALQTHVSALRKVLPPEVIVTEGYGYRLDLDGHVLDADEFTALAGTARESSTTREWDAALDCIAAALALWRGPPYEELSDDGFARPEIARLEELQAELVELRTEVLLGLGRPAEALADLERLVGEHPLRERLWEHLMTAQYRLGRHADALAAYREAWTAFTEIGLEPSAELRRLEQKILIHAEELTSRERHNLPAELTAFVGRDREHIEVAELLARHRMVTLTGVGGAGKTRLALRVAGDAVEAFPDGCWLAELASLRDPSLAALEVANAVGLRPQTERVLETLVSTLAGDTTLIVLDNCEHVLESAAAVSRALLEAGTGIKVLATSREPLRVPGEVVFDVPPMSYPAEGDGDPGMLRGFDAVRLYEERASRAEPSFTVDAENGPAVATICRRLDGIPLAIELAAARVGALSPSTIADRLDDRFRILTGGSTTGPERHETLEAALDWSYELLDQPERRVFTRLSVFRGGFTLDAAEAVCAGEGVEATEVVPLVSRLTDKSLVSTYEANNRRYRLLETVREYSAQRLDGTGEVPRTRGCHLEWASRLASELLVSSYAFGRWERFARLDTESDNLEAGLEWARIQGDGSSVVLAQVLAYDAWGHGQLDRCISHVRSALSAPLSVAEEAEARFMLAVALFFAGNVDESLAQSERVVELFSGLPASSIKVRALGWHGRVQLLLQDRDPAEALPYCREAFAVAEATEEPLAELFARVPLGRALAWNGDVDGGVEQHYAALDIARSAGDPATTLDIVESLFEVIWLHPTARRTEPLRILEKTREWLPPGEQSWGERKHWDSAICRVHCQVGEWDRADAVVVRRAGKRLQGWEKVGELLARATLRWMQGRLSEARDALTELERVDVNPWWYSDLYPLQAEIAADDGRLDDVRAAAEAHLALDMHTSKRASTLAVLSPLARAEVDAGLRSLAGQSADHVERALDVQERARHTLKRFPPLTGGSPQLETPTTYLALIDAEVSRATGPTPALWEDVVVRADYCYYRLYASCRLAEALVETGSLDEASEVIAVARADATRVGAARLRPTLEALAERCVPGDPQRGTSAR